MTAHELANILLQMPADMEVRITLPKELGKREYVPLTEAHILTTQLSTSWWLPNTQIVVVQGEYAKGI